MTAIRLPKKAYRKQTTSYYDLRNYIVSHRKGISGIYGANNIIDRKWFKQLQVEHKVSLISRYASMGLFVGSFALLFFVPSLSTLAIIEAIVFGAATVTAVIWGNKTRREILEAERIEFEGVRKALNEKFHDRQLISDVQTHETAAALLAGKEYAWLHGSTKYTIRWTAGNEKYEVFKEAPLSKSELSEIEQVKTLSASVAGWRDQLGEYVTSQHEDVRTILLTIKRKAYALAEEKSLTGERVYQVQRILNDSLTAIKITKRLSAQTEKNEDSTLLPILEALNDELTGIQSTEAQNIQYELEKHALFIESRK